MEKENNDDEYDDREVEILLNRYVVNFGRVDCSPHHIDPTLCCHHTKKRDESITDRIEVRVCVHPLSPVIKTFVFSFNICFEICLELFG